MQTTWRWPLACFLLSVLAGSVMISSDSLWIDEGQTLRFAQQPTLQAWLEELRHNTKSETQMPLAMLVAWVAAKILGVGEWQLRAPNLLWTGLAGTGVGLIARALRRPAAWWLFLLHPFLWFYTNEARPYAMQICAGTWLLYVLVRIHLHSALTVGDAWIFGVTAILGLGSSLLFAFTLLAVLVVAVRFWFQGKLRSSWTQGHWTAAVVTLAGLLALGIYHLHTLTKGASGAKLWSVTPLNLVFALYEALGFAGLGPARNTLRNLAHAPAQLIQQLLQPRWLLGLGTFGLFYIVLAARLWKMRRDVFIRWLLLALILTGGLLYGAASLVRFPFWGRHLAPALSFVVLLVAVLASGTADATACWRRRGLTWVLAIAWAASSLTLRFSPEYAKDDYRGASRLALGALAAGQVVWWSADPEECAAYYGLSLERVTHPGARLVFCHRPAALDLPTWPAPDLIIQSKPDVFDAQGKVSTYLEQSQFREVRRLPAFIIWAKPSTVIEPVVPSKPPKPTPTSLLGPRRSIAASRDSTDIRALRGFPLGLPWSRCARG